MTPPLPIQSALRYAPPRPPVESQPSSVHARLLSQYMGTNRTQIGFDRAQLKDVKHLLEETELSPQDFNHLLTLLPSGTELIMRLPGPPNENPLCATLKQGLSHLTINHVGLLSFDENGTPAIIETYNTDSSDSDGTTDNIMPERPLIGWKLPDSDCCMGRVTTRVRIRQAPINQSQLLKIGNSPENKESESKRAKIAKACIGKVLLFDPFHLVSHCQVFVSNVIKKSDGSHGFHTLGSVGRGLANKRIIEAKQSSVVFGHCSLSTGEAVGGNPSSSDSDSSSSDSDSSSSDDTDSDLWLILHG